MSEAVSEAVWLSNVQRCQKPCSLWWSCRGALAWLSHLYWLHSQELIKLPPGAMLALDA